MMVFRDNIGVCGISFSVYIVTPTYLERVQQDQGFVVVSGVNSGFTRTFMINVRACNSGVTAKCIPLKGSYMQGIS